MKTFKRNISCDDENISIDKNGLRIRKWIYETVYYIYVGSNEKGGV
mgnify:CR=1 FL=1